MIGLSSSSRLRLSELASLSWSNLGLLVVRKPDLVLWDRERAFVADITVTSEQVGGVKANRDKVAYYDKPEIREWVHQATGVSNISFSAVAANWWAVLLPLSADFLKSVLKLPDSSLPHLSLRICEETSRIHRFFHSSTMRESDG